MTTYYVRHASDGMSFIEDFWAIDDGIAHQGIIPSQLGTHTADPGEDIMTLLEKRFPGSQFHRLRLGPGEYFPRMARPGSVRQE